MQFVKTKVIFSLLSLTFHLGFCFKFILSFYHKRSILRIVKVGNFGGDLFHPISFFFFLCSLFLMRFFFHVYLHDHVFLLLFGDIFFLILCEPIMYVFAFETESILLICVIYMYCMVPPPFR